MKTATQNEKGEWVEAMPEPYYPSIFEKCSHILGKHVWTFHRAGYQRKCVMCGKIDS